MSKSKILFNLKNHDIMYRFEGNRRGIETLGFGKME
jgi:hypothetical protein